MSDYKKMLIDLKNKTIPNIEVKKEEYLIFREVLIQDADFKHFRGEAKQGGNIIFTYLEQPRV